MNTVELIGLPQDSVAAPASPVASAQPALDRPRVLIVDDESAVLFVVKAMLGRKRYDIRTAETLNDASEQMDRAQFDLIIADLNLGEDSGLELLRKAPKATRVMLMSGAFSNSELVDIAMDEGAASYISKPLELSELLTKTARLTARKAA